MVLYRILVPIWSL